MHLVQKKKRKGNGTLSALPCLLTLHVRLTIQHEHFPCLQRIHFGKRLVSWNSLTCRQQSELALVLRLIELLHNNPPGQIKCATQVSQASSSTELLFPRRKHGEHL